MPLPKVYDDIPGTVVFDAEQARHYRYAEIHFASLQ